MKKCINILLIFTILTGLWGCGSTNPTIEKVSKTDFYFDTVITITLYNTSDATLIDDCFSMAAHYESLFSATKEDSDIAKINENAGISSVIVDPQTIELIKKGIYYRELSDGDFDLCCGKLSSLWNISEIAKTLDETHQGTADMIPQATEIDACVSSIQENNSIVIDEENSTVYLPNTDIQMDLGAIAKGYIADQMRSYLNEKGITSGVISLGGNILTLGPKNTNTDYTIAITMPFAQNGEIYGTIQLPDGSVVTSGNYERYFVLDNKIYHHILDLKTGYPVDNILTSVTIVSESSCDGDALSTICFILGPEKGMQLIESLDGIDAIFILNDRSYYASSGFDTNLVFKSEHNKSN